MVYFVEKCFIQNECNNNNQGKYPFTAYCWSLFDTFESWLIFPLLTYVLKGMPNQSAQTLTAHSIGLDRLKKKKTSPFYR